MIVMLLGGAQHAKSFQAQECSGHFRICLYMCVPFSSARLLRSFMGESPMGCTREEGHWYSVQDLSLELRGPLLPLTCFHPLSPLYCFDSITYLQRASLCSPNLHHHSLSKVQFLPVRPMPAPRSGLTTPLQAGFLLLILNTFPKEVQLNSLQLFHNWHCYLEKKTAYRQTSSEGFDESNPIWSLMLLICVH